MIPRKDARRGSVPLNYFILPVLFFIGGTLMFGAGILRLHAAHQSNAWPNTPGIVESSGIKASDQHRGPGSTNTGVRHDPKVIYSYLVDGSRHESERVLFGQDATGKRKVAMEIAARYPKGMAVRVSYKPDDPAVSVLEPGIHLETWLFAGLGIAFLLGSLLITLVIRNQFGRR